MQTRAGVLLNWLFRRASPASVHAQGGVIEWETLTKEVMSLHRAGKYERAVVVATKALAVAEKNAGPDHPDVAQSLENMATLYQATNRAKEAETLGGQAVDGEPQQDAN